MPLKHFKKGSPEAREFMANLRKMRGKKGRAKKRAKKAARMVNPRPKLSAQAKRRTSQERGYIARKSQSGKPASTRLKRRRKANVFPGTFPNPKRRRKNPSRPGGFRMSAQEALRKVRTRARKRGRARVRSGKLRTAAVLLAVKRGKQRLYWKHGLVFDTERNKARIFPNVEAARRAAKKLAKLGRKIYAVTI